jgi:hypothetical protein
MGMTNNTINTSKRAATVLGLTALTILSISGCKPTVTSASPIPPGHAEIHIEYKGLSTDTYNKLNDFIRELAEEHSVLLRGSETERDVGDGSSYHGFLNAGHADQRYNPDHPVPSPEVEEAMQARLDEFLEKNGVDPDKASLELRYGPAEPAEEPPSAP